MSCEGKLGAACVAMMGGGGSALALAFGNDVAEATAVLEETFRVARAQADAREAPAGGGAAVRLAQIRAQAADRAAEDATVAFFTHLRDVHRIPAQQLPAHGRGRAGVPLPKRSAMHGYAAVWETIQAAEQGRPLPPLTQQVRTARQRTGRTVSSLRSDAWSGGGARCANCGEFASLAKGHTCPQTTTAEKLRAKLMRALAVPESAYPGRGAGAADRHRQGRRRHHAAPHDRRGGDGHARRPARRAGRRLCAGLVARHGRDRRGERRARGARAEHGQPRRVRRSPPTA